MPRSGWLAVGAVGTALAATEGFLPGQAVAILFAAALAAAIAAACWPGGTRVGAVAIAVGAALILGRLVVGWTPAPAIGPAPDGTGPWSAVVESVGTPRGGAQSAIAAFEPDGPRVALTLPRYPIVEPGFRIVVAGSFRPPPDDGYGAYLRRIGVTATLRSRTLELAGTAAGPAGLIEGLRRGAGSALARALPEPEAGLAAGILIGLRDRVDREVAAAFTTAGVSHVVAISGWNIAIVAASVGGLAGRLGRRRRSVVILAAIGAYVAFAGASPSVVRAGAMATVVLLARETGRRGQAASALALAVVLLLLADPGLVRDAGFQLSAAATAGLLAWAAPLDARLRALAGGRLPGWLVESLAVSLAAQAATLPIVLATFGRLSIVAPVVNLGVVPLVVPAMAGGGIALLAGSAAGLGLPVAVAAFIALPGWLALAAMVALVGAAARLPFASLALPAEAAPLVGAAAACGLLAVALRPRSPGRARRSPTTTVATTPAPTTAPAAMTATPSKAARPPAAVARRLATRLASVLLALAVAVTAIGAARAPAAGARVTILDVGQGDAILVEGGSGGRLLIDGGPDPDRLVRVLDARLPPWDRRLDIVVVTHPHEDHVAGIPLLLARYTIGRILETGMRGPGPGFAALAAALAGPNAPIRGRLAAGDRLRIDEIDLRVLWPEPGRVPEEPPDTGTGINNVSIVLLGEVAGRRFLLTGDVEEGIDPILLAGGVPRLDLLKVAHHGSATASTDAFLAAARPAVAVTSAGFGNPYGHPAPSTLSRLRASGATVFRTDTDGSVEVTLGSDGVRVRTDGARQAAAAPRSTVDAAAAPRSTVDAAAAPRSTVDASAAGRPGPIASPFSCGILRAAPDPDVRAAKPPPEAPAVAVTDPADRSSIVLDGAGLRVGYHPVDDGPRADGSRRAPALPRSPLVARAPRARRRRDRGLPRGADRGLRDAGRPPTRRDGRIAPRRRQGTPVRRSRPPPAARGRLGGLARPARSPGARARGREPPGHVPARRGAAPALGRIRFARGADRRLLRQAGGPARRTDGRAVRVVGPPLPRHVDGGRARGRPAPCRPARGGRLPRRRRRPGRRATARLDRARAAQRRASDGGPGGGRSMTAPLQLGYYHGDDGYGLERAADAIVVGLAAAGPVERWRVTGEATSAARIGERVGTASLFGGGTVAIVVEPGALVRSKDDRAALVEVLARIAPGNGLVFLESSDGSRRTKALEDLAAAVAEAGGDVRGLKAPKEGQLAGWIEARARERGIVLGPGAAKELATRVGGFVREGDVDRRRQGQLAVNELDKLALYRPGAAVSVDDVRALVAEVIPGSAWAFLDAVAARRAGRALELLERLRADTHVLVILAQLHRRMRELLVVADYLATGTRPGDLVRILKLKPYRAEKLVEQARTWTPDELERALEGLLEVDTIVRGADGAHDDAQQHLALTLWIAERVGRPAGAGAGR